MANTYTQVYIQFVFAVRNRKSLIDSTWEDKLYRYITGIVQKKKNKMIAINGMPDHIHIFVGLHPTESLSGLMQTVKGESAKWINKQGLIYGRFSWQAGYGAFSYSKSHIRRVYRYVMNQKEHHKEKSFRAEYIGLLEKFNIDYDEKYILKSIEY